MRSSLRTARLACGLLLIASRLIGAESSPQLATEDAGTPGPGRWEINVGISTERRPGSRASELPLLEVNYGLGERWQLKYEVPYLRLHEDGAATASGWGDSGVGVKWRFLDGGEDRLAASVFPQAEFATPGAHAEAKGLGESETTFLLPLQFECEASSLTYIGQLGREFRADGDSWFYGAAVSRNLGEKTALAVELAGRSNATGSRSQPTANLGAAFDLSAHTSLLVTVGRELHNHAEAAAKFIGYLGIQVRL